MPGRQGNWDFGLKGVSPPSLFRVPMYVDLLETMNTAPLAQRFSPHEVANTSPISRGGRRVGYLGRDLGNFGWRIGVLFESSGGVKRFDLQGGNEGGNFLFWRLRRPFFHFSPKTTGFLKIFLKIPKFSDACGDRGKLPMTRHSLR